MTKTKIKQSIQEAVHEYYSSFSLSDEQIVRLQAMQNDTLTPQEKLKAVELQLASRAVGNSPSDKILSLQDSLDPNNIPSISTSFQYDQMQLPTQTSSSTSTKPVSSSSRSSFRWMVILVLVGTLLVAGWFGIRGILGW